jgi:hypothetical protein
MRKIRLDLDELQVDSFTTAEQPGGAGTVRGYVSVQCGSDYTCNYEDTCAGVVTCARSCGNCGTYYCASGDPSCTDPSCVYSCTCETLYTCPPTGCV